MTRLTGVAGDFWTAENPEFRVRGKFTAKAGQTPRVNLASNLVHDPRISVLRHPERNATTITFSAEAARSVASFLPITLRGVLDTGAAVTLLDARNYAVAGFTPNYRAHAAVFGAHVSTDQRYSAVRFRMDSPFWLAHLTDGESSMVEDDGSTLSVDASIHGNWLVYESSTSATLRQLEMRVVSGCLALLQLALCPDKDRVTRETQVRIDRGDPWLTVRGPAFCRKHGDIEHETLLTRDHLTVERFAKWIELHGRLDGLPWVVARPLSGAEQTRVLLLTPLVEGFHRRLPYEQSRFPTASRNALDRVKRAARRAATETADDEPDLGMR
jgi:hypothetical protein